MITLPLSQRLSPFGYVLAVLAAVLIGGWCLTPAGHSQAPAAATSNVVLAGLLTKLKTQQTTMAANQTKIEAQTALLKEEIRQAKIYSARGGAGHR